MKENTDTIDIRLLKVSEIPTFITLRTLIDRESEHLIAKKGERKQNLLYTLAVTMLNRKRTHTFIAWDGDKAIGYLSLVFAKFKKYKRNSYLVIALRAEYRGRGIGSKLMEEAENFAKRHGKYRVELEVFAKNTNAVRLYEQRGYIVEGVKKNAVEDAEGFDDVIIMTKSIQ